MFGGVRVRFGSFWGCSGLFRLCFGCISVMFRYSLGAKYHSKFLILSKNETRENHYLKKYNMVIKPLVFYLVSDKT